MAEISGNLGLCYKCGVFFDKCVNFEISVRRVLIFCTINRVLLNAKPVELLSLENVLLISDKELGIRRKP